MLMQSHALNLIYIRSFHAKTHVCIRKRKCCVVDQLKTTDIHPPKTEISVHYSVLLFDDNKGSQEKLVDLKKMQ